MALQVWMPLTDSVNNQGLSNNITTENNGPIISNQGKIGSCYQFDGEDDYISLTGDELYTTIRGGTHPFSVAFWVYHNDDTRAIILGDYMLPGAINFNIELLANHTVRFYWNATPNKIFADSSVGLQTWAHVAIVYTGTEVNLYVNGTLISDKYIGTLQERVKTDGYYYLGRDNRTGATVLNGRLNDFRIYDHALSAKEIHLLSQGLVAHYPLNREGFGNENLVTNSLDVITSKIFYSTTTELGTKDNAYVSTINTILPEGSLTEGDMLSVQFNYEVFGNTKSNAYIYTQICGSAGQAYPDVETNSTSLYVGDKPKGLFAITYRVNATQASASGVPRVRMRLRAATDGAYFKMWNLHVERGPKTPWVPCSEDNLYSAIGLDNGIIYDVSGYSNNITEVENISYAPDTPKYNMAAQFANDTHGKFTHPFANGVLLEEATFSYWVKREVEITNESYMCSGLVQLYLYQNSARIRWYARNEDGSYDEGNTWNSGFVIPENEWVLVTFVFKDSYMNLYINGEYKTRSNRQKYIRTNRGTRFGASTSTGTNGLPCKVSDFRIYTTALSDDDIMELYNSPISVANTGSLLTSGEFSEE